MKVDYHRYLYPHEVYQSLSFSPDYVLVNLSYVCLLDRSENGFFVDLARSKGAHIVRA